MSRRRASQLRQRPGSQVKRHDYTRRGRGDKLFAGLRTSPVDSARGEPLAARSSLAGGSAEGEQWHGVFIFYSSKVGCWPSVLISVIGTLVLIGLLLVLNVWLNA